MVKVKKNYIVRHGETEAKIGNLVSGHMETHLTENGKREMFEVGEKYKNVKFDVAYISPLMRSRESAEAFLKGAEQEHLIDKLIVEGDLIEINYGPHEGMDAEQVRALKNKFFDSEEGKKVDGLGYAFPGTHPKYGEQESFRQGADRYEKVLKKIGREIGLDENSKNVLIISHSGVMRAMQLCEKLKSAGAEIGKDLQFGEVLVVESDGENIKLSE
jgi:broad specificity phosphatase PhoE